jgi:uncharacterized protein YidB (DUF937 family)
MGLLDSIIGGLTSGNQQHAALFNEVGTLVKDAGGVGGLQQQFEQNGLGSLIQGWISNGPNPPITGQQIIQVLGQDRIAAMASKVGLNEGEVAAGLTALLPIVIDHLTPHGTVPDHSPAQVDAAMGQLQTKLAAGAPASTPEPGTTS